jgi:hypothetical protein
MVKADARKTSTPADRAAHHQQDRDDLKDESMSVPFDRVIWTAEECAAYLGQAYKVFLRRTQHLPTFPKRCPIPGHPRWSAQAVTAWALGESQEIPPESRQHLEKSAA